MKNLSTYAVVAVVYIFMATTIIAEVIHWEQCPNPNPNAPINCTVHEVRVNPCSEAAARQPCRLKRGRKASISFDYTPNFSGDTLEARAYWASSVEDIAFIGMETNACNMTTCPATSGVRQTYAYDLKISKNFPSRNYDVKWKLWNTEKKDCCFLFKIKLYK